MSGTFSSKRHLLFDLDGTLIDSAPAHARAYVEALRVSYPDLARNFNYTPFAGQPTRQVFRALGIPESELDVITLSKQEFYRTAFANGEVELFPGAGSMLASLLQARRDLYLVTGSNRISVERILDRLNLRKFFRGVITAEDAPAGKPAPDPYLFALSKFGLEASSSLAIEDGASGVRSAQEAGLDVVLLHAKGNFPGVIQARDCQHLATLLLK